MAFFLRFNTLVLVAVNGIIMLASSYLISVILGSNSIKVLLLYAYSSPFVVINSLAILYIFTERVVLKQCTKFISWLSAVSLGVYIIHAHPFMLDKIITFDNFSTILNTDVSIAWVVFSLITVAVIYIACGVLETIRQKLFKVVRVDAVEGLVGSLIDKVVDGVVSFIAKEK